MEPCKRICRGFKMEPAKVIFWSDGLPSSLHGWYDILTDLHDSAQDTWSIPWATSGPNDIWTMHRKRFLNGPALSRPTVSGRKSRKRTLYRVPLTSRTLRVCRDGEKNIKCSRSTLQPAHTNEVVNKSIPFLLARHCTFLRFTICDSVQYSNSLSSSANWYSHASVILCCMWTVLMWLVPEEGIIIACLVQLLSSPRFLSMSCWHHFLKCHAGITFWQIVQLATVSGSVVTVGFGVYGVGASGQ